MLAKLIVWGTNREEALNRMDRALQNYRIKGVRTIIPFLLAVIRNSEFREGYFDTGFIENTFDFDVLRHMKAEYEEIIAAIAAYSYSTGKQGDTRKLAVVQARKSQSRWKQQWMIHRKYS